MYEIIKILNINNMEQIFETPRLILTKFELSDAKKMWELNDDPDVIKFTGDPPFVSIYQTKEFIKNYKDYKENGFGRWAVISKDKNDFIGWCGLKLNKENFVDIGFRFFKKDWNKGYATESAKACLNYGFSELKINEIIGRASSENKASIKVLEKLNMDYWKNDECKGIENSVYYRINRSKFKKL